MDDLRPGLDRLEQALAAGDLADARPALALAAGEEVAIPAAELNGARRRALLLLATGGDPRAGLDLEGRAVTALAAELFRPERRASLGEGLAALSDQASGLERISAALDDLRGAPDLAWRAFAAGLLADELSE